MTIGLGLGFILASWGCSGKQSDPSHDDQGYPGLPSSPNAAATQAGNKASRAAAAESGGALSKPIGYLKGQPIRAEQLQAQLAESAGGQVLFEYVLDARIAEKLKAQDIKISEDQIKYEEKLMLEGLDKDINQAQRVLTELRNRRGLGPVRFRELLYRNAALRQLVPIPSPEKTSEMMVRQEYEIYYGTRYEVRIIVVESLGKAQEVLGRLRTGETFVDLAVQMSTDSSRQQGGLLSPFNTLDESYPKGIREFLPRMTVGQVSDPISLGDDKVYALVRLERKIEGNKPNFDDVKNQLTQSVILRIQRVEMDQMVRAMMSEAQVTLTSNLYIWAWDLQQKRFGPTER